MTHFRSRFSKHFMQAVQPWIFFPPIWMVSVSIPSFSSSLRIVPDQDGRVAILPRAPVECNNFCHVIFTLISFFPALHASPAYFPRVQ